MVDVVLVDIHGDKVGTLEKYAAHRNPGFLHKAVSVVLYRTTNSKKQIPRSKQDSNTNDQITKNKIEILLQKRSEKKPLWPGYWANSVCTHPLPNESVWDCAQRRLKEEIGVVADKKYIQALYSFYYRADFNENLSEHELDDVVMIEWQKEFELQLNSDEVEEVKWLGLDEVRVDMEKNSELYAPWPKMIFNNQKLINYLSKV